MKLYGICNNFIDTLYTIFCEGYTKKAKQKPSQRYALDMHVEMLESLASRDADERTDRRGTVARMVG